MINNTEIRGSQTSASFFDLMSIAREVVGVDPGQPIDLSVHTDFIVLTPSIMEYNVIFIQINFENLLFEDGSVLLFLTNDGQFVPSNEFDSFNMGAGGDHISSINFYGVGSKFIAIKFVGFTQGTVSSITLNCKR
jgi:hypothetical protein